MRKIAIFTGTRAEYGLLYWIIKGVHESSLAELQLLVGGMHLSPEFGYTINQIEQDGFPITERMEFLLSSDSPVGIAKSMSLALIAASELLERQKPDLLVILGDRFEAMAVAQAAMVSRIPIAHIHGGETTEGLIDEAVRHSITKMAHLHFTATEAYRKRVIQLGEHPNRVFNTGAPGIDNIVKLSLIPRSELSEALAFDLECPYFLVTYHPVTLVSDGAAASLEHLLTVLDSYPNHQVIISYPNADTNGRNLIKTLEKYRDKNPKRVLLVESLGQLRYLSVMKHSVAVLGNSSSGLIEAPTFGVPTLNIGMRQKGRLCGDTVISCNENLDGISESMKMIMDSKFQKHCRQTTNPYGKGDASEKILKTLLEHPLEQLVEKSFYDLELT